MGIELYWDNDEQTVMLCEVDRSWTWDEMDAVLDKVKKGHRPQRVYDNWRDPRSSAGSSLPRWLNLHADRARPRPKNAQNGRRGTSWDPLSSSAASPVIQTIYKTLQKSRPARR